MPVGPFTLSQLPAILNLNLYAGDDFTMRLPVKDGLGQPADLQGATVRSQIRLTPQSVEMLGVFAASIDASTIVLRLTSQVATILPARSVYDVELTLAGDRTRTLAAGAIQMTPEVTRD